MRTTPWFLRSRRVRRVAAVALAVDLGLGVLFTGLAVSASAAEGSASNASAASAGSAVTVKWTTGRHVYDADYVDDTTLDPTDPNQPLYRDLEVTVSQTEDLTDQGLRVSWTGGKATSAGGAASNFLQIMQCWAPPGADGPKPEQCQWGTPSSSLASQTGTAAATRDLQSDPEADPKQDLGPAYTHKPFGTIASHVVPFWSVDDPRRKGLTWTNDPNAQPPFGAAQSNEVTFARTAADGTGQYIVNLQSALSAPYLGCGDVAYSRAAYSCWLVVVPRGEYNLNGDRADQHDDSLPLNPRYVAGSPLSATAWQNRIQVKLDFSPIGASCKLGSASVPTAGSELVAGAFSSWQSALCSKGATFDYSQVGDGQARSALTSPSDGGAGLEFLTNPPEVGSTGDETIEYAPVATSSLVFSYLIDKNYTSNPDNPDKAADGTLVTDLRLSPLLVAKLLTQSYKNDTPGAGGGAVTNVTVPAGNPASLRQDPEFLKLNPNFKYFYDSAAPDGLIVPFGDTDAAQALWTWVRSDSAARRFLSGKPDTWGTRINAAYTGLDLDSDASIASFPKADPSTFQSGDAPKPGYGTLDLRPYSNNLTDGARRTVTASAGAKIFWDITKVPAQYVGGAAQLPGSRFEIALTTSQAASLYGLPTASLVTDADDTSEGVSATASSMSKQMTRRVPTDTPGVYRVDPSRDVEGGYPLTIQTYAGVNVCAASTADLTAYATFLDYVGGAGQVSGTELGQLPLGYAPLGGDDKSQARSVAADLRSEVSDPQCASHQASAGGPPPNGGNPTGTPSSTPSSTATTAVQPPSVPAPGTPVGAPRTAAAPAAASPASDVVDAGPLGVTPVAHVSAAGRYAVVAAGLFALPCLFGGPAVIEAARRRR